MRSEELFRPQEYIRLPLEGKLSAQLTDEVETPHSYLLTPHSYALTSHF